jgi:hypothetical protein
MNQIQPGPWVEIEQVVLTTTARPTLPEDTNGAVRAAGFPASDRAS